MRAMLPEPGNSRAARIVWQKLFLLFEFIYAMFRIYFALFAFTPKILFRFADFLLEFLNI